MPTERERPFLVVWPDDRTNQMSSDEIKKFSIDAESWANFLAMLMRRRKFAKMRVHNVHRPAERNHFKVLWHTEDGPAPTYASLN